jgi:hypothetical protein
VIELEETHMTTTPCRCGCEREVLGRRSAFASRTCANRANGQIRQRTPDLGKRPIAWACGAGVDSTAIAVLICKGELPPPDFAWIVDVGYEPRTTWAYVEHVLQPRLAERGVALHVNRTADYTNNDLVKKGFLTIPAYRKGGDGKISKLHTHCSAGWKARVAERWLRGQGVTAIEQWIGIAADEMRRAKPSRRAWIRLRYPLVERDLSRADCIHLIGAAGWPLPERTSCWLCPHRSIGDWRRLAARNGEDFELAVEAERQIQRTHPDVFLHQSGRPLNAAVNGCRQPRGVAPAKGCEEGLFSCS